MLRNTTFFLIFSLLFLSISLFAAEVQIVNLKVEYAETPLGIDVKHPRFSWQMNVIDRSRGWKQLAYQLVVKDEGGNTVWDSDRVKGETSLNIEYAGKPLSGSTRYNWEVSVWDQNNKKHSALSWFETGLMSDQNLAAWNGAKWIGGDDNDLVLYPSYLPVFKINLSLQLDQKTKSTRAGFIYGANDNRLMDRYKNLYQLENQKDHSYILIELDVKPLDKKKNAQLNIFRVGYHPDDKKDLPFKSFQIPHSLINAKNKYDIHSIKLSSNLGETLIYVNGEGKENLVAEVNLNPLGRGGDFIAFPMVADIGFNVPKGQIASFSKLEIRNYRSPNNILFTENLATDDYEGIFTDQREVVAVRNGCYKVTDRNSEVFVTRTPQRNSMPMLRTVFSSKAPIQKARLYVTARGVYEIYMNGKRVGDDYFNPGLTQYNKTHLYQTYDVTDYVRPGKNALGAILGEGWWSGGATYMGGLWNFFGDRQSLLAKLVVTYKDGKEDVIVTDPSTWRYYNNGPIMYGSFFQGEVYDATKETLIEGWSAPEFNDHNWKKTTEIKLEGTIVRDEKNKDMPVENDYRSVSLISQFGETVKKIREISAKSVDEVRPGCFVYDMGQNMAGVPKITLAGIKPGTRIILRFAEVKYPDLPEYKENVGMIMLENIRAAMAQDIYITKGGDEVINPRFTFHGYRFVEITGLTGPLPLEAVKGEVLSSIHDLASSYETSNTKVNKLWENITWSTYSNFISIPTDCPQRNERLGWSGDISVFSGTATYLANLPQFLRRHMRAMRDVQREDGRFSDVAPLGGGFGGVLWGSAGIAVPWESYLQYGDKELLKEHYPAMKKYIEFIIRNIDPKTQIVDENIREQWWALGDWLSLEYEKTEKSILWESYFIYDLEIVSKIADILGQTEDVERFAKLYSERKDFFNQTFIEASTGKTAFRGKVIDTQASYALPIAFNIFDEKHRQAASGNLKESVARENKADNGTICPPYSLMTGFIGTAWINRALSSNGSSDIAYRLLQQTSYPSWLYSVEQGATTIWERLNSYTHTNGFGGNNRMNSFNHYSFGAIGSWMYNYSLGIERDENSPGFKHFILHPEPDPTEKMTYAKGYYDSMYGRIESGWQRKGNIDSYHFVVPANTTATLFLNALSEKKIAENGRLFQSVPGVKFLTKNNGKCSFELQSGEYNVQVTRD